MYIEAFPEKLKKARQNAGFTQVEAAKQVKIAQSTLANYETARTEPDIETLGKLITLYNVTADWLLSTGK